VTAPLIVVREPEHAPARQRFAQALHDPEAGRLSVEVLPTDAGKTPDLVAIELLTALGKDFEMPASYPNQQMRWARVCAWLIASDIRTIILGGGQLLHLRAWSRLFELACVCDLTVWVISRLGSTPRKQRHWLAHWPAETVDWPDFEQHWKAHATRRPRNRSAGKATTFPRVPATDFTAFLEDAQQTLSTAHYARVRAETLRYARDFFDYLTTEDEPHDALIAERLLDYISETQWVDEALTRLRGAQLGAFHAGWSLKVDYPALHARLRGDPPVGLTRDRANRLRRFPSTLYAAVGAAALVSGASPRQLARIRVDDLADDASALVVGHRSFDVPVHGRDLLRAQRVFRHLSGATGDDALLIADAPSRAGNAANTLHWYLRGIRQSTGIDLKPKQGNGPRLDAKRWSQRYGLSLKRISAVSSRTIDPEIAHAMA
jgi:hypothetical protein